jgi:hypothetical protein
VFFGDPVRLTVDHNLFFRPGEDVQVEANGREYTSEDIAAGLLGPGNRVGDPLFVRPAWGTEGDFHLNPGSPAMDRGASEGAPATDLDGNGRPRGSGVDIGCYEFIPETGIDRGPDQTAPPLRRFGNFPNPFNPLTTLIFDLEQASDVRLELLNASGERVRFFDCGKMEPGRREFKLDASGLPSGVYICRLQAGKRLGVLKLMVAR